MILDIATFSGGPCFLHFSFWYYIVQARCSWFYQIMFCCFFLKCFGDILINTFFAIIFSKIKKSYKILLHHQCYFLFFNLTFHNKFCIKLNFHSPPSLWRSGEICTFVRIFFKTCPFPFLPWKTYSILTEFTVEIRGHINVHKHYNI